MFCTVELTVRSVFSCRYRDTETLSDEEEELSDEEDVIEEEDGDEDEGIQTLASEENDEN